VFDGLQPGTLTGDDPSGAGCTAPPGQRVRTTCTPSPRSDGGLLVSWLDESSPKAAKNGCVRA
jgi:hypothetical protein